MARYRTLILAALSAAGPWAAGAAEHAAAAAGHGEGHGLPLHAVPVWPGVPVTNSMIVTWVVAAGLILFARMATRRMQAVPSGLQNFWEWLVEGLYGFLGEILGRSLVRKSFWFFASLFIFILASNYVGLLPGIGTIGYGVPKAGSALPGALETVSNPLFRGVNADLNMTFAMGMIFMVCWFVWALQANGVKGFFLHIFGPQGESAGFMRVVLVVVFIFVGLIEVVSISFRPISLAFRLYGNIYAGENMLESVSVLIQEPAWARAAASVLLPIPFYFLELLVGVVQAMVFMLLTAVFTMLICQHDEPHGAQDKKH